MAHKFGGVWTEKKIDIFLKYVSAYLNIMKNKRYKLLYFDGFAGSGEIEPKSNFKTLIEGVASKVISIDYPKSFDMYYLVEKDKNRKSEIENYLFDKYPQKKNRIHVVESDCNDKMIRMSAYLKEHPNYRTLAFIDPHGMEVNWDSLVLFKDLGIDMWLLVPSGIGYNRLLTKYGKISQSWLQKLKLSLGLNETQLKESFYRENPQRSLFSDDFSLLKESDIINKIIRLYSDRLKSIWKYVSKPLPLKNSKRNCMYHFMLISNNKTAINIANDIIRKNLKEF